MRRPDLVPDCERCAAVCCVATSFDASEDFAYSKSAGVACRYLRDCRCAIHAELPERGFRGCAIYDCYGAGPRATRAFSGPQRDDAFLILRAVHELLFLLTEAAKLCPPDLITELASQISALDALEPADLDLRPHRAAAHALLRRIGDALGSRRSARLVLLRPVPLQQLPIVVPIHQPPALLALDAHPLVRRSVSPSTTTTTRLPSR